MNPDVLAVLRAYPQIYLSCHREHRTRARSISGLTGRETSVLAHIGDGAGAGALARHLGVASSSLSAMLKRLAKLGLVEDLPTTDARRRRLRLTPAGSDTLSQDSVLDPDRVETLLNRLDPEQRRRAVDGLNLLAQAANVQDAGGGA